MFIVNKKMKIFECGDLGWAMVGRTSDELRPKLHGRSFCVLKTDLHIAFELGNGRYWEEWMLDIFREHYYPNTDMMDIGAHIGTSALLMEEVCSNGCSVHAFEPIYHRLISHTLALNGISPERVRVYPYAVGSETKEITTTIKNWALPANFGASALDHSVPVPTGADYFGDVHVTLPVIKINTAVLTRRVSVIKIDVEGMEIQVVAGIKELLERDRPVVLIEIWEGPPLDNFKRFMETELPSYDLLPIPQGKDDFILVPKATGTDA